jgi:hypothetical protein
MLSTDRAEQAAGDGVFTDATPACVALVPVAQQAQWSQPQVRRAPPDPTFVAQLIAAAEHIPQTLSLRRAATADALSAYRSYQAPKVQGAGSWTPRII